MKRLWTPSRREVLALGLAACGPAGQARAQAVAAPQILVELFTSQGCSSCPKADELLAKLVDNPNLAVLSFHVDYWDYLGWRDTFAQRAFSERQYAYAASRGDDDVYTPQVVVNGRAACPGNKADEVASLVKAQQDAAADAVPVHLTLGSNDVRVDIPARRIDGEASLWLMAYSAAQQQAIARGENAGKTITYHNVVRNMVPAAMWRGEAYAGSWMRDAVMPSNSTGLLAVLQQGATGRVLGLARA